MHDIEPGEQLFFSAKMVRLRVVYLVAVCLFPFVAFAEDEAEVVEEEEGDVYVTPQIPTGSAHFVETFDSGSINVFKSRWVKSEAKKEDVEEDLAKYDGEWDIEAGAESALRGDLALALKTKAKHHAVSAFLDRPFKFESEEAPFIVQYDVRFQEGMECGGAYLKLLSQSPDLQLPFFHDKTPYTIMFGPDKCGNDHKLHFIFRYTNPKNEKAEEKHMKLDDASSFQHIFTDHFSHLLTLQINPDSSFELKLDQTVIRQGSLLKSDFKPELIPPEEIDDPEDKKPEDWDERPKIPDPEAVKPDDWDESEPEKIADPEAVKPEGWLDDEPSYIPDPRAEKPSDWDTDLDGEWEAPLIENVRCQPGCGDWKPPMIANPKYKGKWHAPQIDNPNYKGVWKPQKIPNPSYFEETKPFSKLSTISAIGLELWSMSNNILFDNFIITNDPEVAHNFAQETWLKKKTKERRGYASSDSVIDFLYKSTEGRPWLWLIYALVLILPITCCVSYFLSKPKPKKKRAPANNQNATLAAGKSRGELEGEEHDTPSGSSDPAAPNPGPGGDGGEGEGSLPRNRSDLEGEDEGGEEEEEEEVVDEDEDENEVAEDEDEEIEDIEPPEEPGAEVGEPNKARKRRSRKD